MRLAAPCLLAVCLLISALPLPAQAQLNENRAAVERMDRLERDLQLLQRQIARGQGRIPLNPSAGGDGEISASSVSSAQLEVRLSAIEEELRGLRGRTEENEFRLNKLQQNMDNFQKDTEFRFNEMQGLPQPAANPGMPPVADPASAIDSTQPPSEGGEITPLAAPSDTSAVAPGETPHATSAGDGVLRPPASNGSEPDLSQPRDLYNYAFRLLNQTQYDESAKHFKTFTTKFPKDPLIGNAYYWLGETYYIKRDYTKAADQFRQGFEALPSGPKAADNLLKLAMSLDALKRSKDACVVLDQILVKFKDSSVAVTQKAQQERSRIGCK